MQTKEDAAKFSSVLSHWTGILNAVNLEMIKRPQLMDPPIQDEEWEVTKKPCLMHLNQTERKLKLMSLGEFALHVQEVQRVSYQ